MVANNITSPCGQYWYDFTVSHSVTVCTGHCTACSETVHTQCRKKKKLRYFGKLPEFWVLQPAPIVQLFRPCRFIVAIKNSLYRSFTQHVIMYHNCGLSLTLLGKFISNLFCLHNRHGTHIRALCAASSIIVQHDYYQSRRGRRLSYYARRGRHLMYQRRTMRNRAAKDAVRWCLTHQVEGISS